MRRAVPFLALCAAASAAFLLGFSLTDGGAPTDASAAHVDQVREHLEGRYYRPVPPEVLRRNTVEAMLAALDDPYTEYLEPVAYSELLRRTAESYTGIGLTVLPQRDGFVVSAVPPGPAREAGLEAGDRVVAIDGRLTDRLSLEEALARFVGPAGSTVRLDVRRAGETIAFDVRRAVIRTTSVESRLLRAQGRRVGYVSVGSLAAGTAQLLVQALDRLERGSVAALVLDLRGNPGGLLDQAVAVSSLFLAEGIVVSIEGAHEPRRIFQAIPGPRTSRLPLAVLVDRYTASAAEVVAGALRDNGRAVLVGETTFGKALVQSIEPLPNGAALKLTTARYLTPSRTDLSRGGLPPHVEAVDDPDTPLDEVLLVALEAVPGSSVAP